MTTKYHINKKGVPAPCKAKNGNCPLGGEGSHFDTVEEAQKFADKQSEQEYGLINSVEEQSETVESVTLPELESESHNVQETSQKYWKVVDGRAMSVKPEEMEGLSKEELASKGFTTNWHAAERQMQEENARTARELVGAHFEVDGLSPKEENNKYFELVSGEFNKDGAIPGPTRGYMNDLSENIAAYLGDGGNSNNYYNEKINEVKAFLSGSLAEEPEVVITERPKSNRFLAALQPPSKGVVLRKVTLPGDETNGLSGNERKAQGKLPKRTVYQIEFLNKDGVKRKKKEYEENYEIYKSATNGRVVY